MYFFADYMVKSHLSRANNVKHTHLSNKISKNIISVLTVVITTQYKTFTQNSLSPSVLAALKTHGLRHWKEASEADPSLFFFCLFFLNISFHNLVCHSSHYNPPPTASNVIIQGDITCQICPWSTLLRVRETILIYNISIYFCIFLNEPKLFLI